MKVSKIDSKLIIELENDRFIRMPYSKDENGILTFKLTEEALDDLIALANQ